MRIFLTYLHQIRSEKAISFRKSGLVVSELCTVRSCLQMSVEAQDTRCDFFPFVLTLVGRVTMYHRWFCDLAHYYLQHGTSSCIVVISSCITRVNNYILNSDPRCKLTVMRNSVAFPTAGFMLVMDPKCMSFFF